MLDLTKTPDRALDAALAVALFGWKNIVLTRPSPVWTYGDDPDRIGKPDPRSVVPHYSSDPAAALAVVEALAERGRTVNLDRTQWEPEYGPWMCRVSDGPPLSVKAATMPRAVAEAALLALDAAGLLPPDARALLTEPTDA